MAPDEKLQRALAIVISDSMKPDDINRIVEDGLAAFSEEFGNVKGTRY